MGQLEDLVNRGLSAAKALKEILEPEVSPEAAIGNVRQALRNAKARLAAAGETHVLIDYAMGPRGLGALEKALLKRDVTS